MGGDSFTKGKVDTGKPSDQQPGKKGFDWMNLIKIPNEEKDHWVCFSSLTLSIFFLSFSPTVWD